MSSGLLLALVFLFGESPAQAESRQDVQLTISNLESQLISAENQLNIDTQTVIADSATVLQAQSDLNNAQYNYDNNLIIETSTSNSEIGRAHV